MKEHLGFTYQEGVLHADEIAVTEIDLGEALVGTAARLSLDGSLTLADGELDADLDLERLDRVEDSFVLDTSFSMDATDIAPSRMERLGTGIVSRASLR